MSKKEVSPRKKCSKCGKERDTKRDFYMSNSSVNSDGRVHICKQCIFKDLEISKETNLLEESYVKRMQDVLLELNLPYIHRVWSTIVERTKVATNATFGIYLRELHLNHKGVNWRDSEFADNSKQKTTIIDEVGNDEKDGKEQPDKKKYDIELDTQNERDVLRLLGFDPFEHESPKDRPNLFNELIGYLDESTLEDGYKLSSVIVIVKTINQISKIDAAISKNMRDMKSFSKNSGAIASLTKTKNTMVQVANNLAKENEISMKHATDKSQGTGTFSGMLKNLLDNDILEAETNLFDVETSAGIKQVADISHQSIMSQLNFDENDTAEMMKTQRELIKENKERADKYEEKNRILRIELVKKENEIKKLKRQIESTGE